jgi:hypothetical protein
MNSRPPGTAEGAGLEAADFPEPSGPLAAGSMGPLKFAGFVVLFLILALLAFAVFLGIAVGVTILLALILPKQGLIDLIAPVVGVGVASVCFGAASRFRKGMLKNRYGLFRRPPRDPGKRLADGQPDLTRGGGAAP